VCITIFGDTSHMHEFWYVIGLRFIEVFFFWPDNGWFNGQSIYHAKLDFSGTHRLHVHSRDNLT
jgi:hypothetical protein